VVAGAWEAAVVAWAGLLTGAPWQAATRTARPINNVGLNLRIAFEYFLFANKFFQFYQ
jgi:hypothetical protein